MIIHDLKLLPDVPREPAYSTQHLRNTSLQCVAHLNAGNNTHIRLGTAEFSTQGFGWQATMNLKLH